MDARSDHRPEDQAGARARLFERPYLLLSFTSLCWASNIVIGRLVAPHIPPIGLSWFRWGLAFAIILPFSWAGLKEDWPVARRHLGKLALFAVMGNGGINSLNYIGLQYTEAINGLLIQSTGPLLIGLAAFALYGDRLNLMQALGILVSLTGVLTIICRADLTVLAHIAFNPGDVMIFTALSIYAVYTAMLRNRPRIRGLSFLTLTMGLSWLILTPFWLIETAWFRPVTFDIETILALLFVAIFPSILAYSSINRGIELIGANRAAPFLHLIPVFGSALAIVVLGERPQPYHAAGYAMVLIGITLAARRQRGV